MKVLAFLRQAALLVALAALVAGCTSSPEENQPGDLNCDGDRDGIPDGQSPVEGTNSTCDTAAGEQDVGSVPSDNETNTTTELPSVIPQTP